MTRRGVAYVAVALLLAVVGLLAPAAVAGAVDDGVTPALTGNAPVSVDPVPPGEVAVVAASAPVRNRVAFVVENGTDAPVRVVRVTAVAERASGTQATRASTVDVVPVRLAPGERAIGQVRFPRDTIDLAPVLTWEVRSTRAPSDPDPTRLAVDDLELSPPLGAVVAQTLDLSVDEPALPQGRGAARGAGAVRQRSGASGGARTHQGRTRRVASRGERAGHGGAARAVPELRRRSPRASLGSLHPDGGGRRASSWSAWWSASPRSSWRARPDGSPSEPPPALFDLDDAFDWVVDHVPDDVAATLTPDDVRRILDFQVEYFKRKGVSANGSTAYPAGTVVIGGAETVEYILERCAATGRGVPPRAGVRRVDTQLSYLRAIGAIGPPGRTRRAIPRSAGTTAA